MRKPVKLLLMVLVLVPLLAGCPRIDSLRLSQDRPEDLEALLQQNEFDRIQRLLERHPELHTSTLQTVLNSHISVYEFNSLAESRILEARGDLPGAIDRIDAALSRLPASNGLSDYRAILENRRRQRLEENQRHELLLRARFFTERRQLEQEKYRLDSPGIIQRLNHTTRRQEARTLGAELLACGQRALQQDEPDSAAACLKLAEAIDDSPEVQATLGRLATRTASTRTALASAAPANPVTPAASNSRPAPDRDDSRQLLVKTEQALKQNDLIAARDNLHELQEKTGGSDAIDAVKQRLDAAIAASVEEMKRKGDRLYRADKVSEAIASWNHALELDPDNSAIQERMTRARRVLAHLEELKNRQTDRP